MPYARLNLAESFINNKPVGQQVEEVLANNKGADILPSSQQNSAEKDNNIHIQQPPPPLHLYKLSELSSNDEESDSSIDSIDSSKLEKYYLEKNNNKGKRREKTLAKSRQKKVKASSTCNKSKCSSISALHRRLNGQVVDNKTLSSALDSFKIVVVYCFAEWCEPCRKAGPIFDDLVQEEDYKSVLFLKDNISRDDSYFRNKIETIPCYIVFFQGKETGKFPADLPGCIMQVNSLLNS